MFKGYSPNVPSDQFLNERHVNMNRTFRVIGLLRSCLVYLILTPFSLSKWLTKIFVDCNRFDKGETNDVRINGPLRRGYINKRRTDERKTKLIETFLITHTNKTKHQNKVQ